MPVCAVSVRPCLGRFILWGRPAVVDGRFRARPEINEELVASGKRCGCEAPTHSTVHGGHGSRIGG